MATGNIWELFILAESGVAVTRANSLTDGTTYSGKFLEEPLDEDSGNMYSPFCGK